MLASIWNQYMCDVVWYGEQFKSDCRFNVRLINISKRNVRDANKQDFERKLNLAWKVRVNQSPKQQGPWAKFVEFFGPNLIILGGTCDELSRGQKCWHTDAGDDNTGRPILASGKNEEAFGMFSEWYYTTQGLSYGEDMTTSLWACCQRARCHVCIRQSPSLCNAILNTCWMSSRYTSLRWHHISRVSCQKGPICHA